MFVIINVPFLLSTPSPSDWYRISFIGANKTNVYYYLIHEASPATYYSSTTKIYLISYNFIKMKQQEKILLRKIENESEPDVSLCKHIDKIKPSINVNSYLIKQNVYYARINWGWEDKNYKFDKTGMYYIKNKKKHIKIKATYLKKFISNYNNNFQDDMKVIGVYRTDYFEYSFYIIQYGYGTDMDFHQCLIPVKYK